MVLLVVLPALSAPATAEVNPKSQPNPTGSNELARQKLPDDAHKSPAKLKDDASPSEALRWLAAAQKQNKPLEAIRKKLVETRVNGVNGVNEADAAASQEHPQVDSGDYDGDGRRDLAVVMPNPCAEDCSAQGPAWSAFVLWGDQSWTELYAVEARTVALLPQTDLTGDGLVDIALSAETCGAHTCFKDVKIYSVAPRPNKGAPSLRLIFDSQRQNDIATRGVELRGDKKPAEVTLSSGNIGSVGAGPFQRNLSVTYQWNPKAQKFSQRSKRWEKSNLRLHRLHDALNFIAENEPQKAETALQEVIDGRGLKDLPDALKGDAKLADLMRRQLPLVARFELAMLAAAQGDTARLDEIRKKLEADAPTSPATAATREFARAWKKDGDLKSACEAAAARFAQSTDKTWTLTALQLGYNSPVKFDAAGLCVAN
ncbi:hypothetical protein [Bradymonas sediminis]|uniref:Uncharacterized protein n=1 Tax=Bradymonas sediminis TaxID=1548548 RepID=A0A2Z4FL44_9DELT|nr:hypothetical protein [Bradymonas sediminis]AWV89673.1 hypothetical protein DN745_10110 [Bradymonas sediminis]TDP76586.1 hypothetical protein DFR33_102218 [Bradymonas sediminis]